MRINMCPGIADELYQSKFRSNDQMVLLNVIFTGRWIERRNQEVFRKYGLSMQQYNVLRILKGAYPEPLNLGDVQSRMIDRMSDTSRLVEKLRKSGLLVRNFGKEDRRTVKILITQSGIDLLNNMQKEERELDGLSGNLSEDEKITLSQLLDKLRS